MIDPTAFIHPKAVVDETVSIGPGTRIWQTASVTRGTVLGADCSVAPGTHLDGPIFGDRCIIEHNCAIGAGFRIGSDVFLAPGTVLCNDLWPRANKDGFDEQALRNGFVCIRVEDGASIGANAVVLPGVVIGKGAMVAAGAVVSGDVPDGFLWTRFGDLMPLRSDTTKKRMRAARAA